MIYKITGATIEDGQLNLTGGRAFLEWRRVLRRALESGRTEIEQLEIELRDTQGGRNLLGVGLDQDLVDCAQIDRLTVVPELDVRAWRIRLAH
jgi:2-phosphosulfolactate phosphatase